MPPSEVDSAIDNLVKVWIKKRAHKRKEYVDQNSHKRLQYTFNSFFGTYLMNFSLVFSLIFFVCISLEHKAVLIPPLPALTRCEIGSKPRKKREKLQDMPKGKSQVGSKNGDGCYGLSQLCIRIRVNSLNYIWTELENLEKKIITCSRNVESAQADYVKWIAYQL
ncbi:unnamed protein product [Musa textilis]